MQLRLVRYWTLSRVFVVAFLDQGLDFPEGVAEFDVVALA